jgi:hypothetical protein
MSLADSILQIASIARWASVADTAIDYSISMRRRKRRCAVPAGEGALRLAAQDGRARDGNEGT